MTEFHPTDNIQDPNLAASSSWAEQDEMLRRLWLAGEPQHQIAEKLQRSVGAIMTRAARLGLPRRFAPGRKALRRSASTPVPKPKPRIKSPIIRAHAIRETLPSEKAATMRLCLMCLTKFASAGPQNRICSSCKDTNAYHVGLRLPDFNFSA
jgi:hypothetical protein